jgi:hypothetical protein
MTAPKSSIAEVIAHGQFILSFTFGSAAAPVFPHPRNLTEVLRPALGGLLTADATGVSGDFGIADRSITMGTSKHINKLVQALLFGKKKNGELNI